MTSKQEKLIENYIRLQVRKRLNEAESSNDISSDSIESIINFLNDLQNNIVYLKKITESNAYQLKPRILQKIQVIKYNIKSIEVELKK